MVMSSKTLFYPWYHLYRISISPCCREILFSSLQVIPGGRWGGVPRSFPEVLNSLQSTHTPVSLSLPLHPTSTPPNLDSVPSPYLHQPCSPNLLIQQKDCKLIQCSSFQNINISKIKASLLLQHIMSMQEGTSVFSPIIRPFLAWRLHFRFKYLLHFYQLELCWMS